MKIQSLSVVVPTNGCINDCRFCVSRMKLDEYKNQMDDNRPFYDLYLKDYIKRLEFARDNGCNTVILTGNGEPQQNRGFLTDFGLFMMLLERPFRNIEMQTTGALLDEPYLRFLRNHVGVNLISLSVSALNNADNAKYNGIRSNSTHVKLEELCEKIKKYDFNLRLSINMTDALDNIPTWEIFHVCKETYHSDQITFRKLYKSPNGDTQQDKWIDEHGASEKTIANVREFILTEGRPLEKLEYGQTRYSIGDMSVVLDDDCMSQEVKEALKYLILRPNCKLYSKWDDKASLIF